MEVLDCHYLIETHTTASTGADLFRSVYGVHITIGIQIELFHHMQILIPYLLNMSHQLGVYSVYYSLIPGLAGNEAMTV